MAKKKIFQISNALTEGLEETIIAAHHYLGELRIDVIPIKRIEVDPDNPRDLVLIFDDLYVGVSETDPNYIRKSKEIANLQTMANSIRKQGIINPIVVYKFGDKYRLVAGERRTLASILAGKSEIQAKILDSKPNDLKISLLQWIENVERTDLSLWERLRNLEKIITTYADKNGVPVEQITITELSNLIGCTKPHAMNYKAVLVADDHVKQLIRDNKIRNLEKAALISGIQSLDIKQYIIDACLTGAPLKKLKIIAAQENQTKISNRITKSITKRGRQATLVNFGTTKNIPVAKLILDSVLKNNALAHISGHFAEIDWTDYKSVTDTFKFLLKKLEELHT
ncbi:MAG TPA: ParB/RepB/Spo0J family partition protein [Gammaproteobacteria bacterium]|nr:ParB/RepB/Spo0J family partition protein [Gammaproteobacteria bacterium]